MFFWENEKVAIKKFHASNPQWCRYGYRDSDACLSSLTWSGWPIGLICSTATNVISNYGVQ